MSETRNPVLKGTRPAMSWAAVAALNNSIDEVSATEHATITFDLKSQEKGPLQCNKHRRFSHNELEGSETATSALPVTSSSIAELQGRTPLFKMITTIVPQPSQKPNARKTFMDLPADILIEILKILLVSSRSLVNIPPTQGLVTAESHVPTGIDPRILRTCQTMADLGLPILYGYNTFKFSGNIPRVETYPSSQTELLRWLASRIESGKGQNKSGKKRKKNNGIVQRSQLIKNVIITVDREVYDAPAAQKAGRHLREQTDSLIEDYFQTAQFQLATLRCLEFLGMNLRTLTMTFDQDSIAVRKSLKRETVYSSKSTHEKASTFLTGEELTLRSKDLLDLRFLRDRSFPHIWIDLLSFHRIYSARGLQVNKFVVCGVSKPQRPWYLPEDEPREEDVKSSQSTATLIRRWLSTTNIQADRIDFSGSFTQRRILKDGTILTESEWIARTFRLPRREPEELLTLDINWPYTLIPLPTSQYNDKDLNNIWPLIYEPHPWNSETLFLKSTVDLGPDEEWLGWVPSEMQQNQGIVSIHANYTRSLTIVRQVVNEKKYYDILHFCDRPHKIYCCCKSFCTRSKEYWAQVEAAIWTPMPCCEELNQDFDIDGNEYPDVELELLDWDEYRDVHEGYYEDGEVINPPSRHSIDPE